MRKEAPGLASVNRTRTDDSAYQNVNAI